ncbi:TlpA disulfide reductase family protein [Bradyrhizobium sp. UFLA01-814]|uniref:TlpA disulfide reductase family protein n=1 Tax=Bradyrhizobium sp. UFLA01-814 TaxID=3023480 RepID=UPI00398B1883
MWRIIASVLIGAFVLSPPRVFAIEFFNPKSGPAPPLALTAADGSSVILRPFEYSVTVVHFFATWCKPCLTEMPALERFAKRIDSSSVRILAVSVAEPALRVRRFVQSTPSSIPILLDRDGAVAKSWHVANLPSTIVLGRRLEQRLAAEREVDWDGIETTQFLDAASSTDERSGVKVGGEEKR